ncbi:GspH/FimT family protein [Vibrio rhodolitus]|uniref:GspH/FimT family protein n=1 Tax=Vibrio rhodolitus TaxID=2231649 RepID=UPI000E0BB5EA|nr:GspH/FimT family protein [Vibrio rhodolitus]
MNRGFNLLELALVMLLISLAASLLLPTFSDLSRRIAIKRLADELVGFVLQAKSEAILRNKRLYAHFSFEKAAVGRQGEWSIVLSAQSDLSGERWLQLSGNAFQGLEIRHSYVTNYITFDPIRGRPSSGSIEFKVVGSKQALKAILANPPGRIRICSTEGEVYGYAACD